MKLGADAMYEICVERYDEFHVSGNNSRIKPIRVHHFVGIYKK